MRTARSKTKRIKSKIGFAWKPGAALMLSLLGLGLTSAFAQAPNQAGNAKTAPATKPAAPATSAANSAATPEKLKFYETQVKPILKASCFSCHEGAGASGQLQLSSRTAILKGGSSGPGVLLDKPHESLIIKAVNNDGRNMPPTGKLPQAQIDILTKWVTMGLPMSAETKTNGKGAAPVKHGPPPVNAETMNFWSFRPVKRTAVPAVKAKAWVTNPIDAFILVRLEKSGLAPATTASKTTLLRRATYDLTGLPPTTQEVTAFLADKSSNAWEKVVDRLLASPRYGEQWGRHWLDLARFAETNSYERDSAKPNAWKYRDYVIQALNNDKPYSDFIMEQLAGDEMPGRNAERLIATGYYRLGIWDDEPSDPKQALYDDLDDIVSTTGQVFLGLTINCARCHDHKLDPIPQKDYYRFLSFFDGLNRYGNHVQRPLAPESEIQKQRAEITAHEKSVKENLAAVNLIESKVRPDFMPVEIEEFRHENARIAIVKKRVPKLLTQAEFDQYLTLKKEQDNLNRFRPSALESAMCVTEDPQPRVTHVLLRGNPHVEGDKVEPAFLSVLNPPKVEITPTPYGDSCGRRTALAKWIAAPSNPLTARVMVNRLWQFHFGRGIVRTSSNFGFQGDKPTHPELLDYLVTEFVKSGWKLKPLHRMIMLSSAYRMASTASPKALAKDPNNDLFWRFDMRRLLSEEVRDSILAVNGSLNPKMYGPGIYPAIPKEVLAGQSRPGDGWGLSTPEEQARRSIYIFAKRSLAVPMLTSFDSADTDFSCPVRFATTQPTQALGTLNSTFINEQAQVFADFLQKQLPDNPTAQVTLALRRVMQREPTVKEVTRGVTFLKTLQQKQNLRYPDALRTFCVIALNLDEFIYLD